MDNLRLDPSSSSYDTTVQQGEDNCTSQLAENHLPAVARKVKSSTNLEN